MNSLRVFFASKPLIVNPTLSFFSEFSKPCLCIHKLRLRLQRQRQLASSLAGLTTQMTRAGERNPGRSPVDQVRSSSRRDELRTWSTGEGGAATR